MILITGAGGLLGANLVVDFSRRGSNVVAVDRLCLPMIDGVQPVWCDLTDSARVSCVFKQYRPNCVIHCAALTDVDRCETDPHGATTINGELSGKLAAMATQFGSQFVYISSDSVFNGTRSDYVEDDEVLPINVYARSKREGEIAVRAAAPDALVVRTNIYGWNMQPKTNLAEWILGRLEKGTEVLGFQDVVFCPILVNDLGDIILEMLERRLNGIFHVAGSQACCKYEFALRLAAVFGLDAALVKPTTIDRSDLRAPRPKNTSLCTKRIHLALGKPMPSLETGLKRMKALQDSGFAAQLKQLGMEERRA